MYHTPQGVVYATAANPNSMLPESLILNFGQNLSQAAVAHNISDQNNISETNESNGRRRNQNEFISNQSNHVSVSCNISICFDF